MKKFEPNEIQSANIIAENTEHLKAIFPEVGSCPRDQKRRYFLAE